MSDSSDEEKTEEPTEQRLRKAREEGQVARSRELTTFMLLVAGVGGLWLISDSLFHSVLEIGRASFAFDPVVADDPRQMLTHAVAQAYAMARGIAPFFLLLLVVAVITPNLLGGWLLSGKSLKPDLGRFNVAKGLGRLFSSNAMAEFAKTVAKSLVVGIVAALFISLAMGELLGLAFENPFTGVVHALRLILMCVTVMVAGFIVVVAIDVPFQIWSHHKKLRMSPKDIKDEHKEAEGDPQVKARIRQTQQRMARQRMMAEIPDADVVITNPTHYAAVLKYDNSAMGAPVLVAKGAGEVAARIREIAAEHSLPQLSAPPLARSLYRFADLDREIPAPLYSAVAEVLAWVYRIRTADRTGAPRPKTPNKFDIPVEMAAD